MPLSDRDYMRGSHPPNCTCTDCCAHRRLRHNGGERRHNGGERKFGWLLAWMLLVIIGIAVIVLLSLSRS